MRSEIERFSFVAIPEKYARFTAYYDPGQPYPPIPPYYEIEVQYGMDNYKLRGPLPPDEVLVASGYLEHLVRSAVEEFRRCVNAKVDEAARKEADKRKGKARAVLENKKREFFKAAEDYKNEVVA